MSLLKSWSNKFLDLSLKYDGPSALLPLACSLSLDGLNQFANSRKLASLQNKASKVAYSASASVRSKSADAYKFCQGAISKVEGVMDSPKLASLQNKASKVAYSASASVRSKSADAYKFCQSGINKAKAAPNIVTDKCTGYFFPSKSEAKDCSIEIMSLQEPEVIMQGDLVINDKYF